MFMDSMFGMGSMGYDMSLTPEQVKEELKKVEIPSDFKPQITIKSVKIQGGSALYCNGDQNDAFITPLHNGIYYYEVVKFIKDGGEVQPEFTEEDLLNRAKEAKKNEIEAAKTAAMNGGVEYKKGNKTYKFQSDDYTRNMLTSTAAAFKDPSEEDSTKQDLPSSFTWISLDNTMVPFTMADVRALGLIMAQHVQTCTFKARQLKDAAIAAKSQEELQKIQWS